MPAEPAAYHRRVKTGLVPDLMPGHRRLAHDALQRVRDLPAADQVITALAGEKCHGTDAVIDMPGQVDYADGVDASP